MDRNDDIRRNGSGYYDPTAWKAISKVNKDEEERFHKLLYALFDICELSGFRIEGRVVLKDLKTGKVWR